MLLLGLVLVAINRVAGLVLPGSSKYLFDNVIDKHQVKFLLPIVLAVVGATLLQGIDFVHVDAAPVQVGATDDYGHAQAGAGAHRAVAGSFYDANKTGVLVSRIMSDVEGVRNLIGTGLVEFVGGLLTAVLALDLSFCASARS